MSAPRTVVVIGAGFAGLAAGDALAAAGVEVTVVEARDRVGGRVHSQRLANEAVVELGAEFVLPGYDTLRATAGRLGLRLVEKGVLYGDREPRGDEPVRRDSLLAAVASLDPSPGGSAAEVLEQQVVDRAVRAAIAARIAVSTAYELDDQPASVLADGAAGFGDFPSEGIEGGNDRLAAALARELRVLLRTPATRVSWDEGGVRVAAGGGELDADGCVVATPAPHTLTLAFDPPLPEWKRHALAAVRYGHAAKLFLPLATPVGPSATLSVPDRFWTWTQLGSAVASSFAGTEAALDALVVEEGPSTWAAAARALRPDLPYAPDEPLLATWHDDPWALGAYSARSLASPLDDDAVARPVGPIAFAGEHTAGAYHGLMEGALRSGVRAAGELVSRT